MLNTALTICTDQSAVVIDMAVWKLEHSPHEAGWAQCTWCAHTWVDVAPAYALENKLICPCCLRRDVLFPIAIPHT